MTFRDALRYPRMKTIRLLSLALLLQCSLFAQQTCKRSSLFFDTDQAELKPASIKKLDSILLVAQQSKFLVELYGHTDTVGRDAYNDRLALQRMKAIEAYLDSKAGGKFQYKEKNFSETNAQVSRSTEANLAYNRRVDLYLLPVSNGMLQLKGANPSESVEVPIDYFEPCGLCGNRPEMKTYYNEKDTKGTNITFETNDGYKLQTAGTMVLDYKPCDGQRKQDTASIVFKICDGKPDEKMTLWQADTVAGKIVWRPSKNKFVLDPRTGCYVFRAPAGRLYNLDKIDYDTVYSIEVPQAFAYQHLIIRDKKAIRYNVEDDSVRISPTDTVCMVHSFAKSGDKIYLMSIRMDSLADTLQREGRIYAQAFKPTMGQYEELTYSDTALKIRTAKLGPKISFGFFLPDYKEFIPMDSTAGKYAYDHKPNCKYQYGYIKGNRLYVISDKNVNPKYASSNNTVQIKFNRKNKKKFRRVSDYKVKDANVKKAKGKK